MYFYNCRVFFEIALSLLTVSVCVLVLYKSAGKLVSRNFLPSKN